MTQQLDQDEKKAKLLALTAAFLGELGRDRAVRGLSLDASLQRDLGIDSLGKVELFHRVEQAFAVTLPETVMVQSETLQDLLHSLQTAKKTHYDPKAIKIASLTESFYDPSTANTLVEVLLKRASQEPNRPHITLVEEAGSEKIITYGELYAQATKVANGLLEYGIEPGETIAIMLPTCEDFFYTFFGVLLIGAIPVPIYPPFRPDRIEEYAMRAANILKNAHVRLLITFQQAEKLSELLRIFMSCLKAVVTASALKKDGEFTPMLLKTSMPALIQYTSGSTSAPKGVLLTHQNLLANIRAAGLAMQLSPMDVGVSWLPLYHDMGLIGSWLLSFYHANPIVILSPFLFLSRPDYWLWTIHYHRATLSAAPNFAYELCIRRIQPESIEGLDLSSWRLAFNGAEAVNPKTIAGFVKKFSPYGFKAETLFPVYGLAESAVALVFPPPQRLPKIDTVNREIFEKEQKALPILSKEQKVLQFVSCGTPIPQHEIRIVDDKDQVVAERSVGYLQFRGPSSMIGYYQQAEATQAIYHDGWWDTGDLAYLAQDELYITGRKKDVIIKAGRNIHPEEIEEVTSQVDGIRKGCVVAFGIIDPKWGTEKLVVVAETKEPKVSLQKKIMGEVLEKNTFVLGISPDEVILVPPHTVPKTSSGKLQRSACKQLYIDKKLFRARWPVVLQVLKIFSKGLQSKLKQWASNALKIVYTAYVSLLMALSVPIIWSSTFLPYSMGITLCRQWARLGIWLMGCPVRINNEENLPSHLKPLIFVANHASYFDSIVLLAVLPAGVQFVAKKELLKAPFLKSVIKKFRHITVDRVDFLTNLADTQKIVDRLQQENQIAFFLLLLNSLREARHNVPQ